MSTNHRPCTTGENTNVMNVTELSAKKYAELFPNPAHVFNSVAFTELNRHKCDAVRYLAFSDTKLRGGLIVGQRGDRFSAPFSAPYGGFTLTKRQPIETFDAMLSALREHLGAGKRLSITLPPLWYDPDTLSKSVNALSRTEGAKSLVDLSYQLGLIPGSGMSVDAMSVTGRQNLRRSLNAPFEFVHTDGSLQAIKEAYGIIRRNHEENGYPLRMSLDDVAATAEVVPADFFLLRLNGTSVAAAQVYTVAPGIAQLINWGDIRDASHLCPMNRLAYELAAYYSRHGVKAFDLGPATEDGIPNEGLCRFKESIGCTPSLKFRYTIN